MRLILRTQTNPYFNIAAEEYALKQMQDECFMLWCNEPSIIVGRHQNTHTEINRNYVEAYHIPVVRRLSGGGTVFHDLGNFCFTYALNRQGRRPDFEYFAQPLIAALADFGVKAEFTGRNDLCINNRKFSGNAVALWKDRLLHHGTVLFSSKMADLSAALNVDPEKLREKGVQSVRARVTNLSDHLPEEISMQILRAKIEEKIRETFPKIEMSAFTSDEIQEIEALANKKYRSFEWTYGIPPVSNFHQRLRIPSVGSLEVFLNIQDDKIVTAYFYGDYFGDCDTHDLERRLQGCVHDKQALTDCLLGVDLNDYFRHLTLEGFLQLLGF